MIDASKVTAVIPTRGDVDMHQIRASLEPFGEVIIWNNRHGLDRQVYSRFMAAMGAHNRVIYTQDDDCVVDWRPILDAYEPGLVVCNMPEDRRAFYNDGMNLIGWGSVWDRPLAGVLGDYLQRFPYDDFFLRVPDRIFTKLNKCKLVDAPFKHLDHAYAADRMGGKVNQARNLEDIAEVRRRLKITEAMAR